MWRSHFVVCAWVAVWTCLFSLSPRTANCCALCTTTAINGPGLRKPLHEDVNTLMQGGSAEIVMLLAAVRPALFSPPKSLFSEIFSMEPSSGPCVQPPAKNSVCMMLQAHGLLHPTPCDMLQARLLLFCCLIHPVSSLSVPVNMFHSKTLLFAQTESWKCWTWHGGIQTRSGLMPRVSWGSLGWCRLCFPVGCIHLILFKLSMLIKFQFLIFRRQIDFLDHGDSIVAKNTINVPPIFFW